jgi:3-hydroxyacyl-[acyl-carrier-protein] dehydratase
VPTLEIVLAADHPAADGHFPGNPVIPGAVLLGEILSALGIGSAGCRVRNAKFLAPVRPGDRMVVDYEAREGQTAFSCRVGETVVMKGEARWP